MRFNTDTAYTVTARLLLLMRELGLYKSVPDLFRADLSPHGPAFYVAPIKRYLWEQKWDARVQHS